MKQGWEIKKLGEVCESDLGKTLNQSKDKGELRPYLCAINVLWDKFDFTTLKETRFEDSELERYSVKKGDLLICEGGDIGRAAIWNYDEVIQYQNALHRVRLDKSVLSRFLLLYLKHLKDSGVLDTRYGKGVTIKHLVKSSLLSIPIPVPPIEEQERIVEELNCLNGVIEKKREQLKELDALAESIFYTMFGDPITNEKGWEVKKLGEVCDIINGFAFKSNLFKKEGDAILRISNIQNGYVDLTDAAYFDKSDYGKINFEKYAVKPYDIVIALSGATTGKLGINTTGKDLYLNQRVAICREKTNAITRLFLLYYLHDQSLKFLEDAAGVAQPNLSTEQMKEYVICIPPLALQQEFADKIEAIEKQKELIKKSIEETEILFNSRMDYYFN